LFTETALAANKKFDTEIEPQMDADEHGLEAAVSGLFWIRALLPCPDRQTQSKSSFLVF
jgi:hypothetical protein